MSPKRTKRINEILGRLADLPDSAIVPVDVAAVHDNVCPKTVRRSYPLVQVSPARHGVTLGYLRHRGAKPTAA